MIALLALALPVFGLCADEPETEIMARSPSFFFEKQVFNRGKADGYKAVIHIVSAKDPAIREPLPGFDNMENSAIVSATISPDENWIFFQEHQGSHANPNHLYRRKGKGLRFEPQFSGAGDFDDEAWKFFCKVEGVPEKATRFVDPPEFVEWSSDGSRLLFSLESGIGVTEKTFGDRNNRTKPGIAGWRGYYNLKTQRFELTDELRESNKNARKRWAEGGKSLGLKPTSPPPDADTARIKEMVDDAIKRGEEWGKQSQPTATPARESAKSNQWAPLEEICSRDNNYCVKIVPKPKNPDERTLFVLSKGRMLAQFATMGYLLDVFYSADNSYVAINNRRANAGDYLWVISLRDGQPLKIPEDVATELGKKELGQISGDHPPNQVMPGVTALCPECTLDNLSHGFVFARGWKSSDELKLVEEFHFLGRGFYGPGAPGLWIAVNKVCRITGKRLSLVKQSVEKETQPSELVKRAWTWGPFHVSEDYKEAVELYEKAAEQGDVRAQITLAKMYSEGRGVSKDEKKAAELYQKAADQGDPTAETNLGWLYHEGEGVPQNYRKAVELFQKAADQGYAAGQAYLASTYAEGKGVPKDYQKAVELYHKAVNQEPDPNALNDFAWFLATCPDDSQRNGKLAVTYATKACELSEWKEANFIGTLAAAFAEVGDFDAAIKYQKQAMDMGSDYPDKQVMEKALKLYQERKPCRE